MGTTRTSVGVACKSTLQRLQSHWFGDIIIHSCFDTKLTIAIHCARRHGDDRSSGVCRQFPPANATRCFESIDGGHLYVHQYQIEPGFAPPVHHFNSISCERRLMAQTFQHRCCNSLVYSIVLGDQYRKRTPCGALLSRRSRNRLGPRCRQRPVYRCEQFGRLDRFN